MKTLIMSDSVPAFCRELAQRGYHVIPTKRICALPLAEQKHADMQILKIQDRIFRLEDCERPVAERYPGNVLLNCLYLNRRLYGKTDAIDPTVVRYCQEQNITIEQVNQGYTRCSALPVNEQAVITADRSIQKAMMKNGVEVLLIQPGYIRLEGFPYGFMGGASFSDDNTVFFFGNIKKHPDYEKIRVFCQQYHVNIEMIHPKEPLTDIGGAVKI